MNQTKENLTLINKIKLSFSTFLFKKLRLEQPYTALFNKSLNNILSLERSLAEEKKKSNKLTSDNLALRERLAVIERKSFGDTLDLVKQLNIENKEGALWLSSSDPRFLTQSSYQALQHSIKNLYPKIDGFILTPSMDFKQLDLENVESLRDSLNEYIQEHG